MEKEIIYEDEWVDAQSKALECPETFEAPSEEKLNNLEEDDTVKICNGYERFWVKIQFILDDNIIGIVDNNLIYESEYDYGDKVVFKKKHIFAIHPPIDDNFINSFHNADLPLECYLQALSVFKNKSNNHTIEEIGKDFNKI